MHSSKAYTPSTLWGHPKGLFILFLTEMWERFSFYGMRALLILFLTKSHGKGSLGWSESSALQLYGIYGLSVYVLGILGGTLADRYIGQRKAVLWGAILACFGHFLLAIHNEAIFILGLCFIAIGVGLFKTNASTMVGGLYAADDPRRDAGFSLFYMGINIGSLLSSASVGYVGEKYGWHYGFGLAGIGMLIGLIIFLLGQPYLAHVGEIKYIQSNNSLSPASNLLKQSFSRKDKDRLLVLSLSFIAVFVFFVAFEQAGGLMNLYTEKYTNRYIGSWQIPTSMLQAVNPAFVIILSPVIAMIWSYLTKKLSFISATYKMGIGNIMLGIGFLFMVGASLEKAHSDIEQSSLHWLINAYLFHTIGELCLSPIALSFITKIAPQKIRASMIGSFFAVIGLANYVAAWLGAISVNWGEKAIFQLIFGVTLTIGFIFILFNKKLIALTHGTDVSQQN